MYSREAEPLRDMRRSSCVEGDVGRLCSSMVGAVDRQSKDLGSNPSAFWTPDDLLKHVQSNFK